MKNTELTAAFFTTSLIEWYDLSEKRKLPWKASKDPYKIWLSEIILQQTRVEQGMPYYLKFVEQFPTLKDLAAAAEDEVLKLWQGLGYYARARNMHSTAKYIVDNFDGKFPEDYKNIRSLKGIGDYTAAAIASFAYGLPHAVLDGNVFRVLARFWNIDTPIDSTEGKKQFANLAEQLLFSERPDDYNQAIMDLGALVCKPQSPLCNDCPLLAQCQAFLLKKTDELPIKSKKLQKKERYFYYFVWKNAKAETVLRKRSEKDIWLGLYDFPLFESPKALTNDIDFEEIWTSELWQRWNRDNFLKPKNIKISTTYRQVLTHQNILVIFVEILGEIPSFFQEDSIYTLVPIENVKDFALPKTVHSFVKEELRF